MTIAGRANAPEVDFFSLHNRKKKTIVVEMLDYGFVEQCNDLDELKGILALLRSGKEGRYPDLEKATEDRILAVLPERERNKILRMRSGPSPNELLSEIDDLKNWTATMNLKNEAMRKQTPVQRDMPPVRGQVAAPTQPQSSTKAVTIEVKPKAKKAIPAYDFRAWEKYNVDAALEEIDQNEEQAREQAKKQREEQEKREAARKKELEALPKSVVLESLQPETRQVYAANEKQKGNDCFKANELEMAQLHYTRSMAFDDTDATLYANRALVFLRTKNFTGAEDDCTRALLLDPLYVKAWSRRGMTRYRRGKYAEAAQDFEEALRLQPESREVKQLLKTAQEKHQEVNGQQTSNQVAHDAQPSAARPAKEPKRFEIIEEEETDQQTCAEAQASGGNFRRFEIIEDDEDDEDDD